MARKKSSSRTAAVFSSSKSLTFCMRCFNSLASKKSSLMIAARFNPSRCVKLSLWHVVLLLGDIDLLLGDIGLLRKKTESGDFRTDADGKEGEPVAATAAPREMKELKPGGISLLVTASETRLCLIRSTGMSTES